MSARPPARASLWHNLGAFFGNIARGWREPIVPTGTDASPPSPGAAPPPRTIVSTRVMERQVPTPQGPVTLRRTVIDEVEQRDGRS